MYCTTEGDENEILIIESERFVDNDAINKYIQTLSKGLVKQCFQVYHFHEIIFRSQKSFKSYNEFELEYSIY